MNKKGTALQRKHYQDTANDYDQLISMKDEHGLALKYVCSIADQYELKNFLDVGCGSGRGVRYLLEKGFEVLGIEPVAELLEVAINKHGVSSSLLLKGEGESLPFADQSFDAVCEFAVLHHVKKPAEVVAEMTRVSRHAVFISDENRFGRGPLWWKLMKLVWWKIGIFPLGFWLLTKGKGYTVSEDGISYSYSVFDSYSTLAKWADSIFFIPLKPNKGRSWLHPLLNCSHVLLCAIRHPDATAKN